MALLKLNGNLISLNGKLINVSDYSFTITVDTTKAGSASNTMIIATNGSGYNCSIDWGDGDTTLHSGTPGNITHVYSVGGIKQIKINGLFPTIYFNNSGDKAKLISINNWGDVGFTSMDGAFAGCTNLVSLANGGIISSTSGFFQTFLGCTSLITIPNDLFIKCTNVSTSAFNSTFWGCSSLLTIPTDLFRYNTLVSTNGFNSTFSNCTSLISIPIDLFRYNTLVSTNGFQYTFYGCISLISIPNMIFKYNLNVSTNGFKFTFQGCNKLQLNKYIFYSEGEQSTRFLNQSPNFTDCFTRTSFTGIQGEAPDLWNCNFGIGTPVTTTCFGGTGNSLTSLSNYNDIPVGWK